MIDSTSYGRLLKQRLQELTEKVSDIDGALREPDSPDGEERATENEDDEVLEDLGNAALNEISRINAALHRIKNGTYGVCTSCGGMINEARPGRFAAISHVEQRQPHIRSGLVFDALSKS